MNTVSTPRIVATALAIVAACGFAVAQLAAPGCGVPPERIERAQSDLCKARAAYKLLAAAAGGKLDPAPGSSRETLERAEDEFCAARAALLAQRDGGS